MSLAIDDALSLLWGDPDKPVHARTAGTRFERLVVDALNRHPREWGIERFKRVWSWLDWPDRIRHGFGADYGIDAVGEFTDLWGGGLCAIQIKFGKSSVPTRDIDSFMAAASAHVFKAGLLVTSRQVAKNGVAKLRKAEPPFSMLTTADMDTWDVDWWEACSAYCLENTSDGGRLQTQKWEIRTEQLIERDYQQAARRAVTRGFSAQDRGQLILPCGTGKSFVSLKIAETEAGVGGTVLYLVPSIALISQTVSEWSRSRSQPIKYLAACSDRSVSNASRRDDSITGEMAELPMPVTTDTQTIIDWLARPVPEGAMRAMFSTYQSLPKLVEALYAEQLDGHVFDLVICDEAHRTTGIERPPSKKKQQPNTPEGGWVSPWLMIHDNDLVPAHRRLYMTATPRVFTDAQKARQARKRASGNGDAFGYSMDDPTQFGSVFYQMKFSQAIEQEHLTDYEVLVILARPEWKERLDKSKRLKYTSKTGKQELFDSERAARLAGAWDGFACPDSVEITDRDPGQVDPRSDTRGVRSAIAFTNAIKDSLGVAKVWQAVTKVVVPARQREHPESFLQIEVDHLDGSTPAIRRKELIGGLKQHSAHHDEHLARVHGTKNKAPVAQILVNAKVLTEGVDVPALDAVVFIDSRTSTVDIVQAVGRVMRKAEGKQRGYIVIPVILPDVVGDTIRQAETEGIDLSGADLDRIKHKLRSDAAQKELAKSAFAPVWKVVRALRSHDDRVDFWVNNPTQVEAKGPKIHLPPSKDDAKGATKRVVSEQARLFVLDELRSGFASMVVDWCGDKKAWEGWGEKAAAVCRDVTDRLASCLPVNEAGLRRARTVEAAGFREFLASLRSSVSPRITYAEAQQMVAQHLVTLPIFDAVFPGESFAKRNPVSRALDQVITCLDPDSRTAMRRPFQTLTSQLDPVYERIAAMFEGSETHTEKIDALRRVYDGFFGKAMPLEVKSLGIAYTPVELVDWMLQATDDACRTHFGRGLTDRDVHILDPFTGTGTFIARLLTGTRTDGTPLINQRDLDYKFFSELHASDLVLLAYYLAAVNIEEARYSRLDEPDWRQFDGLILADTLLQTKHEDTTPSGQIRATRTDPYFAANSVKARNQARQPIQVIVSNPPWSAGQKAAGDNTQKLVYDTVAERIRETYGKTGRALMDGKASGTKAFGNLFVHAFRWATDRVDWHTPKGDAVVCFVHPNSLSTGTTLRGMRRCLRDVFTDIYVVNLRGDAHKSGQEWTREGDNIFGGSTRNGIQITLCVRSAETDGQRPCRVHYLEVPDSLSREEKFKWLNAQQISDTRNADSGWVEQSRESDVTGWGVNVDPTYDLMTPLVGDGESVAEANALGITTNCDVLAYDFTRADLRTKICALIDDFNHAVDRLEAGQPEHTVFNDPAYHQTIKWTNRLKISARQRHRLTFDETKIRRVLYRPFTMVWLYEDWRILSAGKTCADFFPKPQPQRESDLSLSLSLSATQDSYRSERSRPANSPISVSQGDNPGQSRGVDRDLPVESSDPGHASSRDPARPSRDLSSGGNPDRSTHQAQPRVEAFEITGGSTSGRADSLLAADRLPDLNSVGPGRGGVASSSNDPNFERQPDDLPNARSEPGMRPSHDPRITANPNDPTNQVTGYGGGSWSPAQQQPQSSLCSPHDTQPISKATGSQQPADTHRNAADCESVHRDNLRDASHSDSSRFAYSGTGQRDTNDTEAVLVTGGSTRGAHDALIASGQLPDLNAHPAGGGRVIAKKRC